MYLVCGLPASGKSTFARRHFRRVLEYDSFAEKLGSYADLEEDRELVNAQFALLASSGLYDAVVDVFPTEESRRRILDVCHEVDAIIVQTPLEECLRRNALRRRSWLSNAELVSIATQCEPIHSGEKFRYVYSCKGEWPMSKIWLKVIDGEVQAFGDEESLKSATGGSFDMVVSPETWDSVGNTARVENGRIVFGDPEQVAYERSAEAIRNERYLRLRQCDKISPMRWNAMSEAQRKAWTDYRQALLDVPQRPGFPWDGDPDKVAWPRQPE
jgi:predicted kinase